MRSRLFLLGMAGLIVTFSPWVAARDIADEVTDVEEITADSEAAKRLAVQKLQEIRAQQQENERELKNAREAKKKAEVKRREANVVLKKAETDLQRLQSEKNQIELDIVKAGQDTEAAERSMAEVREKVEKIKADVEGLKVKKEEAGTRLKEVNLQKDEFVRQVAAAEDERSIRERELEKLVADEKVALDEFEKIKAADEAKKAAAEARVAALKSKFRQLREQRRSTYNDIMKTRAASKRLDEQARIGAEEINRQLQMDPQGQAAEPKN